MKKATCISFACMALAIMASCGGNHSSHEIAKLQDSIASLNAQLDEFKNESKKKSSETVPGTYTFTDKSGRKWTLTLHDDKSGRLETEGYTAYCSWWGMNKGVSLTFGVERPVIGFEKGKKSIFITHIIDGYIYADNIIAPTKDPNWRLPIAKIK